MIIKKYRTDYISQAKTLLESFGIEAVPTIEYTGSRGEIWVDCPVGFLSLDEGLELIDHVYRLAVAHELIYTRIHFDAQIYSKRFPARRKCAKDGAQNRGVEMKKTSTERSSERDARMREAGLTQRKVWARPEDWGKIQDYVFEINSEHEGYTQMLKEMRGRI